MEKKKKRKKDREKERKNERMKERKIDFFSVGKYICSILF
jgi:hypothetical protein